MGVFVFGMGYAGTAAARAIRSGMGGETPITGTVRSAEAAAVADGRYRLHVFDGAAPGATLGGDLARATHVIVSIPPGTNGDPVLNFHQPDLDAAPRLEWLCYFSTVGVYGDFGGGWVDEDAPTRPDNQRSQRRLAVEQAWRDYAAARGVPLLILRLAGIYGPGRSAFDKLRGGTARRIVKPGQVFNRIHVEDIGRATMLAARARLGGTFNLADDEPAPPQDVVAFAARLAGTEPPPEIAFEDAAMTPMARSFYADNKRVSNSRIKAALGMELLYPSYRDGLRAILEDRMTAPKPAMARPARVVLEGRWCRLEPLAPAHAQSLFDAAVPERYRWLPTEAPGDAAAMAAWIAKVAPVDDPMYWAVLDRTSGRAEGRQALMRIVPEHGVIEIGGVYWGPAIARTRVATEAVFLAARHVFDDLGYRRFEWKCDALNVPSRRAAERFGFVFEGIFRQHMIVKGRNRDTAWFAMLDADWPRLRAEYERWLLPENFDPAGQQLTPLRFR